VCSSDLIIQPWLLRETLEAKRAKLEQMGRNVFGLTNPFAEETLAAIEAFYRSLRMPLHLRDAGITESDAADRVWTAVQEHGNAALGTHAEVDAIKTERIVRAACA
jgi:NADP-dependent alcohol dehydrogenase